MKSEKSKEIKPAVFGGIRIKYKEPDPKTYQSVEIYTRDFNGKQIQKQSFATGDANYDYHCAMLWLEEAGCEIVMGSSSCDHFQMDGGIIDLKVRGLKARLRKYLSTLVESRPSARTPKITVVEVGPSVD